MVFVVIAVQAVSLALYYFWRSGPPPAGAARIVPQQLRAATTACRNNCVLLPLRQAAPALTLVVGRRSYWTPERREEWE